MTVLHCAQVAAQSREGSMVRAQRQWRHVRRRQQPIDSLSGAEAFRQRADEHPTRALGAQMHLGGTVRSSELICADESR